VFDHDYWEQNISVRWLSLHFDDPQGELGALGPEFTRDRHAAVTLDETLSLAVDSHWTLKFQSLLIYENYNPSEVNKPDGSVLTRTRGQISNSNHLSWRDDYTWIQQSLVLSPTWSDTHNDSVHRWDWSGNLDIHHRWNQVWESYGEISRSVRQPLFAELFGDRGQILGNPDLKPQKGWQWSLGQQLTFESHGTWSVAASYFERRYSNWLSWVNYFDFLRAQNLGPVTLRGIEAEITYMPHAQWEWMGSYTYQDARDDGAGQGRQLVGRPEHQAALATRYHLPKGSIESEVHYLSGNFLDALNTRLVRDRWLWDAAVSWQIGHKHGIVWSVKNILNQQIEDIAGYPLAGRTFYLTWSKTWEIP
jgi:outer membrane receptor protein involved in Fe transport